jgi:hypothetical protein
MNLIWAATPKKAKELLDQVSVELKVAAEAAHHK